MKEMETSEGNKERTLHAHFGSTYTKIGMIQRLAWPLCQDDMQICEVFPVNKEERETKFSSCCCCFNTEWQGKAYFINQHLSKDPKEVGEETISISGTRAYQAASAGTQRLRRLGLFKKQKRPL